MAYSSSVKRAQAVKLCELCYEGNINWRCTDCEMSLCEKCKTFHLRVPVTAKHHIVTIATPIQDFKRRIITDNIPCKDHGTKTNCLFCQTCDCLVCPECVSSSHAKHQFIPMEKAVNRKLEQLKGIKAKVTENLKFCNSKNKEMKFMGWKYKFIFDESVTKIKQREQELKNTINQYSRILEEEVEVERSKMKTFINKVEQDINEARKELEDLNKEIETVLVSNQGHIIFESSLCEPVLKFDSRPKNVQIFIPEQATTIQIRQLFESIKKETNPIVEEEFNFEVLSSFTTNISAIQQVIPFDANTAWIKIQRSSYSVIRKVTFQKNKGATSKEISLGVTDMALMPDNNILLTKYDDSDVKLMTQSGQIKYFLTVAPLFPTAIHVTSTQRIMIGVKEPGNQFTPIKDSQRAVLEFNMDGKQIHTYQYDKDGTILFTNPYRITTNHNQDILVIDRTSCDAGRVVTLDRQGHLKWTYEGNYRFNYTEQLDPLGIATSAEGYTIVSDYTSHTLHVLNENGYLLAYRVMETRGIVYPMGLNIDMADILWVGCCSGGKKSRAKLHKIKLL